MCEVSIVVDNFKKLWPDPNCIPLTQPNSWFDPFEVPVTMEAVKREIARAREEDRKSGTPDCSSGEKLEWLEKFEKRLEALEKRLPYNPEEEKVT